MRSGYSVCTGLNARPGDAGVRRLPKQWAHSMHIREVIRVGVLLLALAALVPSAAATSSDAFATVPESLRPRLEERLRLFVELHRGRDWGGVYDMIAPEAKEGVVGGLAKERFLRERLYSRVQRFTATATVFMGGDGVRQEWSIEGCAEFEQPGPNARMRAGLSAYWTEGDWYFSDIWSSVPCIDCAPEGCKL